MNTLELLREIKQSVVSAEAIVGAPCWVSGRRWDAQAKLIHAKFLINRLERQMTKESEVTPQTNKNSV